METVRDIAVPASPVGRVVGLVLGLGTAAGLALLLLGPAAEPRPVTSPSGCDHGDRVCEIAVAATEVWAAD